MTPRDMLNNAATASQVACISDHPVVRGAILRSIAQWLDLTHYSIEDAIQELKLDEDFGK